MRLSFAILMLAGMLADTVAAAPTVQPAPSPTIFAPGDIAGDADDGAAAAPGWIWNRPWRRTARS